MKKQLTMRRVICYLLYFLFVCMLVFGITNARYYITGAGTGSAQAAAVAMNSTIDLTEKLSELKPGNTKTITFAVNNYKEAGKISEVSQDYSITVTTTGNLPLQYELSLEDETQKGSVITGNYVKWETPSQESFSTIWNGGYLPHSVEEEHTYVLAVTWPGDENQDSYADEIDLITLTVDAKQAGAKPD